MAMECNTVFTRQVVLPVKMSNGPSKDVLFQIAHTAGLPNHAAWLFLFSLILAGRLPDVTADAPATDVLNIAQTT